MKKVKIRCLLYICKMVLLSHPYHLWLAPKLYVKSIQTCTFSDNSLISDFFTMSKWMQNLPCICVFKSYSRFFCLYNVTFKEFFWGWGVVLPYLKSKFYTCYSIATALIFWAHLLIRQRSKTELTDHVIDCSVHALTSCFESFLLFVHIVWVVFGIACVCVCVCSLA